MRTDLKVMSCALTDVEFNAVHARLTQRMIGMDEGIPGENSFQGADILWIRQCFRPGSDVQWSHILPAARDDITTRRTHL